MEPTFSLPPGLTKVQRYEAFTEDYRNFIEGEDCPLTVLANTTAALREAFGFFWVGFYLVASPEWLALGPFQGSVACSRIRKGRGVCGTAWAENRTLVVPDVDAFPGHIACSSASRSEIVIPIRNSQDEVCAVLDIDSDRLNDFDDDDRAGLESVMAAMKAVIC